MKEAEAWHPLQLLSTIFFYFIYFFLDLSLNLLSQIQTDWLLMSSGVCLSLNPQHRCLLSHLAFGIDAGDLNLGFHVCKCFTH